MDKLLALEQFVMDYKIRNCRPKTIESYRFQLTQFFDYCGEVPVKVDITKIKEYLLYLITVKKYGTSSQNVAHSSIMVFFKRIFQLEWPRAAIGRPKVENKLPQVLNQKETKKLISSISNLKQRAAISLIYSSGLRISEFINLAAKDIDSTQMYVMVRGGKGQKDRTTLLSMSCLILLREYYLAYRPAKYLFNGANKTRPYGKTSLNNIVKNAAKKAGITKSISIHTLRHSFATHLLENGCNLFYIKELMGHKSLKTTMVYLHLCSKCMQNIQNPLDKMFGDEKL